MIATVHSALLHGGQLTAIRIEVSAEPGLKFQMSGTRDPVMREAPDRIRAAFQSMGWRWPGKRITMLLHPLDMHKSGATLDLPMALAIAMATARMPVPPHHVWALGALNLSGRLCQPDKGGVAQVKRSIRRLPPLTAVNHVSQAIDTMKHWGQLAGHDAVRKISWPDIAWDASTWLVFELVASGGHPLLLEGHPDQDKVAFAHALHKVLEVLHKRQLPLREPAGMLSVKAFFSPSGEWDQSTGGLLFVNQAQVLPASILSAMGQAMMATHSPADRRWLLLARSPCACGYQGSQSQACLCTPSALSAHERKFNVTLLQAFHLMHVMETGKVSAQWDELIYRCKKARAVQAKRGVLNAFASKAVIKSHFQLAPSAHEAMLKEGLRQGQAHLWHLCRVARSAADLDGTKHVLGRHVALAVSLSARVGPLGPGHSLSTSQALRNPRSQ